MSLWYLSSDTRCRGLQVLRWSWFRFDYRLRRGVSWRWHFFSRLQFCGCVLDLTRRIQPNAWFSIHVHSSRSTETYIGARAQTCWFVLSKLLIIHHRAMCRSQIHQKHEYTLTGHHGMLSRDALVVHHNVRLINCSPKRPILLLRLS